MTTLQILNTIADDAAADDRVQDELFLLACDDAEYYAWEEEESLPSTLIGSMLFFGRKGQLVASRGEYIGTFDGIPRFTAKGVIFDEGIEFPLVHEMTDAVIVIS